MQNSFLRSSIQETRSNYRLKPNKAKVTLNELRRRIETSSSVSRPNRLSTLKSTQPSKISLSRSNKPTKFIIKEQILTPKREFKPETSSSFFNSANIKVVKTESVDIHPCQTIQPLEEAPQKAKVVRTSSTVQFQLDSDFGVNESGNICLSPSKTILKKNSIKSTDSALKLPSMRSSKRLPSVQISVFELEESFACLSAAINACHLDEMSFEHNILDFNLSQAFSTSQFTSKFTEDMINKLNLPSKAFSQIIKLASAIKKDSSKFIFKFKNNLSFELPRRHLAIEFTLLKILLDFEIDPIQDIYGLEKISRDVCSQEETEKIIFRLLQTLGKLEKDLDLAEFNLEKALTQLNKLSLPSCLVNLRQLGRAKFEKLFSIISKLAVYFVKSGGDTKELLVEQFSEENVYLKLSRMGASLPFSSMKLFLKQISRKDLFEAVELLTALQSRMEEGNQKHEWVDEFLENDEFVQSFVKAAVEAEREAVFSLQID